MTTLPPSPFVSSAVPPAAEKAVASSPTPPACDATASSFVESSAAKGGQEASAVACWEPVAADVFDHDDYRAISLDELVKRGFDVDAFMLDVEPLPQFLQAPLDVLNVLAAY